VWAKFYQMNHKAESRAIPDNHNAYFKSIECDTHGTVMLL